MAFGTAGRRLTLAAASFTAAIAVPVASTSLSASAQTARAVHGSDEPAATAGLAGAAGRGAPAPAGAGGRALAGAGAEALAGARGQALAGPVRRISYRGYVFAIPAGWPVISLSAHRS